MCGQCVVCDRLIVSRYTEWLIWILTTCYLCWLPWNVIKSFLVLKRKQYAEGVIWSSSTMNNDDATLSVGWDQVYTSQLTLLPQVFNIWIRAGQLNTINNYWNRIYINSNKKKSPVSIDIFTKNVYWLLTEWLSLSAHKEELKTTSFTQQKEINL